MIPLPVVHACESVEKFDFESSCWFLFGFAGIRGTEKSGIALSLRTGTQRMSQYWNKFHTFFCNWQMYISPALFMNSLDIFSFFVININKSQSLRKLTFVSCQSLFLQMSPFTAEDHLFTVRQKGVGGGYHSIRYGFSVAVKTISIPVHIVFVSSLTLLHKLLLFSCAKSAKNWNERSWLVHQWKCPPHQIPCPLKATNHNSGLSLRPCEYYMTWSKWPYTSLCGLHRGLTCLNVV